MINRRKQQGYLNVTFSEFLSACVVVVVVLSVVGGGIIYWLIPKLWAVIKPFLHAVMA